MLRTLKNSSLTPDQDEASSYRAVEFRVARGKAVARERLPLPEKDQYWPQTSIGNQKSRCVSDKVSTEKRPSGRASARDLSTGPRRTLPEVRLQFRAASTSARDPYALYSGYACDSWHDRGSACCRPDDRAVALRFPLSGRGGHSRGARLRRPPCSGTRNSPGELIAKETSPKAPSYRSTGRVGHAPEYCRLRRSPETLFCPPTARIVGDPEVIHFDGLSANRTGGSVHQQALRQRGLTAKSCLVGKHFPMAGSIGWDSSRVTAYSERIPLDCPLHRQTDPLPEPW